MSKKDIEEVKEEVKEEDIEEDIEEVKEEVKEEDIEEEKPIESKKGYSGDLRGFKTLEDAIDYPNTAEFKKLDIGCRTEYQQWLKSILEEE